MNMQLTAKLRIHPTPEQEAIFRQTTQAYTESFNRVCQAGWSKKRVNGVELHHDTYKTERALTELPSQLVISARMKATETLRSARTLEKKKDHKVSMPRSKRCPLRYDARSATVRLAEGWATVVTLEGRQHVAIRVPKHHQDRIDWKVCSTDLREDGKGRFWLHAVLEKDIPQPQPTGDTIGVDLGVRRPAVTSQNQFLGSKHWREVEARNFRLRRALQAKGTKSAKRHLKKLSGRMNRFRRDCDHVLSKRMVQSVEEGSTIVLEDLTDIRARVKGRKKQRRRLHSWSFAQLKSFVEYKAELAGILVTAVDPRYTSQKCSRCGKRDCRSRKNQSEFHCTSCGFQLNADLNAARNIRVNHLASLAKRETGGLSVNQPIVARVDVKASNRGTATERSYKPLPLRRGS